MSSKTITICVFFFIVCFSGVAQKIVVDTTSSNKYLLNRSVESKEEEVTEEDLSFGDRAVSIGMGILNRLKARLNLEEATETLKEKKEQYLGKKDDEGKKEDKEEGDG